MPGITRPVDDLFSDDRTAEALKNNGNLAMGEKSYWKAIEQYNQALKLATDEALVAIIERNRSLAFLKVGKYDAALFDTGYPNMDAAAAEKTQFRAGEALYKLACFSESVSVLQALLRRFPQNKEAASLLERADKRFIEQATGRYDFLGLQSQARTMKQPLLDVATFTGPIEVKASKGKGAEPYGYVSEDPPEDVEPPTNFGVDLNQKVRMALLRRQVEKKMHYNPSLAQAFRSLYYGGGEVESENIVGRILSHNAFCCPLTSLSEQLKLKEHKEGETDLLSSGIWTQASYFNHSCLNNAISAWVGDLMLVHATQDIEEGAEITICYLPNSGAPEKDTFKPWGFDCDCALCQDIKRTPEPVLDKRQSFQKELINIFAAPEITEQDAKKAISFTTKMDKTYKSPKTTVPRVLLWQGLMSLAGWYMDQKEYEKVLHFVKETLTSASFIVEGVDLSPTRFKILKWGKVMSFLIEPLLYAVVVFRRFHAEQDTLAGLGYTKIAYCLLVGEDQTFDKSLLSEL